MTVTIDIVSDVMCPWCFIGKKRLEKAIQALDGSVDLEIVWRPFQLDPTLPPEGKNRRQYLEEKFGSAERAQELYENVKAAARSEGIELRTDDIAVSPNTLDAHRLISWAYAEGGETMQGAAVDALFSAYFLEGRHIGDHDVLGQIAGEIGMDGDAVKARLATDESVTDVQGELENAHRIGVTGVPCFIIDKRYGVSGAQSPEVLANAIRQIADQQS